MKKLIAILQLSLIFGISLQAQMQDDPMRAMFLMDKLEVQMKKNNPVAWDANGYVGYDIDKLYIYSEGESASGETESKNEIVYSRAITSFLDIQAGIETDTAGSENKSWGVLAIQGLYPYFIESRMRLMLSDDVVGINFNFEYEALLTQKLILTPSFEVDAYSADVPKMGFGKGLSSTSIALRLRYEFYREFAPYVGLDYTKTFGNTSKYNNVNKGSFILGLRFWF